MGTKYFVVFIAFLLLACSDQDEPAGGLTPFDQSVINYFTDVALGFEFGGGLEVTRKWTSEMRIFVGGTKAPELMTELQKIQMEINTLATDGFNIKVVTDSLESNFYIFLGSSSRYAAIYPSQAGLVGNNWGLFSVFWNPGNELSQGHMYVDLVRANAAEEKHLLREELTQSLGLAKDSPLYQESIFQSRFTTTNEYAEIDKELIRLLYHPAMRVGLTQEEAEDVLSGIILSEK
jgi:hypothetical protein